MVIHPLTVSKLVPLRLAVSTTTDPAVAVAYGQSAHSLLFKIVAKSFMSCGADISFLSAYPGEKEILFPPLTFLQPTGRPRETIHLELLDSRGAKSGVKGTPNEIEPFPHTLAHTLNVCYC